MHQLLAYLRSKSLHLIFFISLLVTSSLLSAAPKSELWPIWNRSNENNLATVDHKKWQHILEQYIFRQGNNNLFNYKEVIDKDKIQLRQYINELSSLDPRNLNRKEQLAYWINLYNALTVKVILDNYPTSSITKLGSFFSFGPWDEKIVTVAKKSLSLNDIEHRILRPIWQDPRIHYAVNCASIGCPNLNSSAFRSDNVEHLLDQAAKQFTNSNKGARIQDNTLTLSSIYDWFSSDFGNNQQDILKHIDTYRTKSKLEGWQGKINYDYDWDLNEPK